MLRGTVYILVDGVPVKRHVLEIGVGSGQQTVDYFKAQAVRMLGVQTSEIEFGPIGEPWPPR